MSHFFASPNTAAAVHTDEKAAASLIELYPNDFKRHNAEAKKLLLLLAEKSSFNVDEMVKNISEYIRRNSNAKLTSQLHALDIVVFVFSGLTLKQREYLLKCKCHFLAYAAFSQNNRAYSSLLANINQQISGQAPDEKTMNITVPSKDGGKVNELYVDRTDIMIWQKLKVHEYRPRILLLYADIERLKPPIVPVPTTAAAPPPTNVTCSTICSVM